MMTIRGSLCRPYRGKGRKGEASGGLGPSAPPRPPALLLRCPLVFAAPPRCQATESRPPGEQDRGLGSLLTSHLPSALRNRPAPKTGLLGGAGGAGLHHREESPSPCWLSGGNSLPVWVITPNKAGERKQTDAGDRQRQRPV